ncbi:Aldo/keto reductase [Dichomitus squalens LYAD-421 SS1]|uniref:Aldo/keto reductase n=1 Tax=Dichomitus squalens (strain LYAD-421) TaxID=732165 RepID=R7SYT6_DICSQ|nr:Aldo/keto reductase [Dichomitus squalens LYAD-421 SS1]EJF61113.1 Aldo/keto reductase [Dichomitus squalens LYAD-421 SS1]
MTGLPTRKLGRADVTPIGFGAMGLSAFYGTPLPDEERLKALDAVLENGYNHIDTADVYGDNEALIGKWLQKNGKRKEIFLATKFGGLVAGQPFPNGRLVCGDPEYVAKAIDRSLQQLGTDYIDLWYLHRADPTVPIERTVAAMAEQVKAGKVKYLGLSEVTADTLRRAHAVHPIAALQVEYSPFALDIEGEKYGAILKTARELGVKIVAYSPVGRGVLAGKYRSPDDLPEDDSRRYLPRFSAENFPKVLQAVDVVKGIAAKHGATPGQVSLAWLLAQGDDILPIPGSTKPANIKENIEAVNVKLTAEEVEQIRQAAVNADQADVPRYPPSFQAFLMADTPPLA